ncbi:hypothetical protein GCM10022248_93960 [Nonomuraea soli]
MEELSLVSDEELLTDSLLSRIARQVGMRIVDVYLVAGRAAPLDELPFDKGSERELPRLVMHALRLSSLDRQRLRNFSLTLPRLQSGISIEWHRLYAQYPPGFGSLLVQMLAVRNMGWSSGAKVIYRMSGIYLSPATIGAIGRGVKDLDPELLNGFAAVLGVPIDVLESLTDIPCGARRQPLSEEITDTASLIWDVRHLAAEHVRSLSQLANRMNGS